MPENYCNWYNWETNDPFVNDIIKNIPAEVRGTFSPQQKESLILAIVKARSKSHHLVDARITIPFFYKRFYVVFLLGKNRRRKIRQVLIERRQKNSLVSGLILMMMIILNTTSLATLGLGVVFYIIQSALGINLFPF